MYESFFGLGRRPFAATPDPECFIPVDATYRAFSQLLQCAHEGRGIGVVTSPAGLGKTLVCQRIVREMDRSLAAVYLPSGSFLTRRSLLQAILFELGHSYVRMGDQELRLELTAALRRLRPARAAAVLIVDEAHLLAPRMLEELRLLTNIADSGAPLVRLIVSGQLSLEDALSHPSLDAFNQRIGCQVTLQALTRHESADYVSRRLAWAGVNVGEAFSPDALAAVCEASDGSPRCLNQLCDHSLLLGYLALDKPISVRTVGESLGDMKQLPLTWNESAIIRRGSPLDELRAGRTGGSDARPAAKTRTESNWSDAICLSPPCEEADEQDEAPRRLDGSDPALDDQCVEFDLSDDVGVSNEVVAPEDIEDFDRPSVVEFGDSSIVSAGTPFETLVVEVGDAPPREETPASEAPAIHSAPVDEEVVIDRYAALDAAISRLARTMFVARVSARRAQGTASANGPVETRPAVGPPVASTARAAASPARTSAAGPAFDVVLPEDFSPPVEPAELQSAAMARAADMRAREPVAATSPADARRLLFSELRRRKRA